MQGLPNGMSNCPSSMPRPIKIVEPTDYSLPEPIDWGECRLPAYEIERQIRERKAKIKLEKEMKEKDRLSRIRKEERRRALRPHGFPPPNTEHRAEVPCTQCYPEKPHIPPTYPPNDEDIQREMGQLCPIVDTTCPTSFGRPGNGFGGGGGGMGGYVQMGGGYGYGGNDCGGNGSYPGGGGMGGYGGGGFDSTQCPANTYQSGGRGGGGGGGGTSPCMTAILERERKERERQEREIRERLEKERIERERRRLEKAEKDLKAREPYMCPGQAKMEKDALKKAKKDFLKGKPLNLNGRNGRNGNGNGNGFHAMSPEEKFGPCVPTGELAPCDPKACPGTSDNNFAVKEVKSRELVAGVLYTGCDCNKRNGLQHDCKRTLCQGRPECLTKPEPSCLPSGGPGYISPCYPVCQPPCW